MRLGVVRSFAVELAQQKLCSGLYLGLGRDAPAPLTFEMTVTRLEKVLPE